MLVGHTWSATTGRRRLHCVYVREPFEHLRSAIVQPSEKTHISIVFPRLNSPTKSKAYQQNPTQPMQSTNPTLPGMNLVFLTD